MFLIKNGVANPNFVKGNIVYKAYSLKQNPMDLATLLIVLFVKDTIVKLLSIR